MEDLKRYSFYHNLEDWGMEADDHGDYVKYEDVKALLIELGKEMKHLKEWKEEALLVTSPIFDWGHNQTDIPLEAQIIQEAVKRLNEYKALKEALKP